MNISNLILYLIAIFSIILFFPNFNKNLYKIRQLRFVQGKPIFYETKIIHRNNDVDSNFEIILMKNNKIINPLDEIPLLNKLNYWMINVNEKFKKKNFKINPYQNICKIKKNYWNYGYLPQTLNEKNEPLSIIDIGCVPIKSGKIFEVKILGILSIIKDDIIDYVIISINNNDPWANNLNDVKDIQFLLPYTNIAIKKNFEGEKIFYDKNTCQKIIQDFHQNYLLFKSIQSE